MMQLFLSPADVWLFRDGRPFDAQSDHRAASLFPPYPSVMQGVIRSHQLVVKGATLHDSEEIKRYVGTVDDYGSLRMRGPFLAKWEKKNDKWELTRYFPVPMDVAVKDKMFTPLKLEQLDPTKFVTSAQTPKLLCVDPETKPTKESPGEWLTETELINCLKGKPVSATKTSDLFARETRFGIGRDDATRTTKEGALYEAEFIRPCKNIGLYLEVDGYDDWKSPGVLRIGGEGRGARYEIITAPKLPEPKKELRGQFKIYFATPTYFENGWVPKDWHKFFEGDVGLVAAALNRYESIGGFDWAKNDHKAARRYVPAGSVYYFQVNGNGTAQLKTNAITDFGAEIGFGQIFIEGE